MRFKNIFLLILGIFAVAAVVWFYTGNQEQLAQMVNLFGWKIPIFQLLLLAFVAGMLCLLPAWVFRDARGAAERWKQKKAVREQAQLENAFRFGVDAVANRRRSEAEEAFRSILKRRPQHRNALIALGEVLRDQGRYEEAAECHRRAIRQDEDDLKAHYSLAEDHVVAGDLPAAEAVYQKIITLRPKRSVAAHEQLRDLYIARGMWARALEVQERLEKLPISDPERRKRIQRARVGLEYEVLRLRMQGGDVKGAAGRLKKLVRAAPEFAPAYVALGEAARLLERDDEALSWFQEGFSKTGSPVFLMCIEDHFLARQHPAGAIAAFRDLAGRRKSDVLPRFFLGRLFSRLEMNDEAWEVFTELQNELPESPTLTYYIARVHERRGDHEEACRLYRRVVQDTQGLRMWFRCGGCGEEAAAWQAYCFKCRAWDTFHVEWMEPTTPGELDVAKAEPVWGAVEPAAWAR